MEAHRQEIPSIIHCVEQPTPGIVPGAALSSLELVPAPYDVTALPQANQVLKRQEPHNLYLVPEQSSELPRREGWLRLVVSTENSNEDENHIEQGGKPSIKDEENIVKDDISDETLILEAEDEDLDTEVKTDDVLTKNEATRWGGGGGKYKCRCCGAHAGKRALICGKCEPPPSGLVTHQRLRGTKEGQPEMNS